MKRRTADHPKVLALARHLQLPIYSAVGILEMLWHFAAEFAPQGDIGKYSDERIAGAVGWLEYSARGGVIGGDKGRSAKLVSALCACGLVDVCQTSPEGPADVPQTSPRGPRLVVHDWGEHMPDSVKKYLDRKGLKVFVSRQRQTLADNGSLPKPLPKPLPQPLPAAIPFPTQQYGDWIETTKAIHEYFPECDLPFINSLVAACAQTFAGVTEPKCKFTDQLVADAIRRVHRPGQTSAGLFSRTVPACIRTWATDGIQTRASPMTAQERQHQKMLDIARQRGMV